MKKITLWLFMLLVFQLNAQTFNGSSGAISDNNCDATHDFPVTVSGVGVLGTVNVFDNVALDITHTWDNDLSIYLIAPDGTQIELSTNNGGSADNYTGTVFSASGATSITAGVAPFTGTFKPEGDFSDLFSVNADGIWILRVCDGAGGDVGTLNSWSITFVTAPSCYDPIRLGSSNITTSSFDLLFTDASGGNQYEFYYVVQPQGTGVPGTFPSGTLEEGINTADYIDYVVPVSGLNPNTDYEIYVAAGCNGTWVGPINFTTLCSSVSNFSEDFDGVATPNLPNCWSSILDNGVSTYAYVQTSSWPSNSGTNSVVLYNSDSPATSNIILVSPNLNNLGAGTHRLKFFAYSYSNSLEIGTLSDPADGSTFTPFQTVALTSGFEQYVVNFDTYTGADTFIALRNSNDYTYSSVYIDDVVWEAAPTSPPSCATNIVATIDSSCGNFATLISWDAASGADGYKITIGSASGLNDILDNVDLGYVSSYSYSGQFNTTYFYTITPYNTFGDSTGCAEMSFTTALNGCYCDSSPTSNDDLGITNVDVITTAFPTPDVTYYDHTGTIVDTPRGISNNVQITFETGYSYNTYILIDFNDDFDFDDAGEVVFTGESSSDSPTTYNASFVMPASAPLGMHRMRIVTADYLPTVDPCYSDSYGVTLDFSINIVEATCSPVSVVSSTIVPDCTNYQYNVEIDVDGLGDGTPSVTDGTNTWNITSTGVVTVGPFTSGSQVSLTLLHGSDNTCDFNLGNFVYQCPPVNDECDNAVALTVNSDLSCAVVTSGTTAAATDSGIEPGIAVTGTPDNDVWYSFQATSTIHQISLLNIVAVTGWSTDMGMAVFSGSCSSLALVADSDPNTLTVTNLTIGETYYVSVYGWSSGTYSAQANFDICVGVPPAPPVNDECVDAIQVNCGDVVSGDTSTATNSIGNSSADVWYYYNGSAGDITISLCTGTSFDSYLRVYDACGGSQIASNDDYCGAGSQLTFTANGTSVYYILVEGFSSNVGTFELTVSCVLPTESFKGEEFKVYPNPVRDILNLEYSSDIKDIRIVNMLGQEVLVQKANATSTQVNMSTLSVGTYIVNVQVGDTVKTLKVIKQ